MPASAGLVGVCALVSASVAVLSQVINCHNVLIQMGNVWVSSHFMIFFLFGIVYLFKSDKLSMLFMELMTTYY